MDAAQLLVDVGKVLWLLLPAAGLVRLCRSRRFKGMMGELRVSWNLWRHLDRRAYRHFSNVLLPTAAGTCQIDHILISAFGIFVIETKNMQGYIAGSSRERSWTQTVRGRVRTFQNPLHQNFGHAKTLQELLRVNPAHLFSIVAFVGQSELAEEVPENVTQGRGYLALIKAKNQKIFSGRQVAAMIAKLEAARLANTFRNKRRHVRHVQSIAAKKAKEKQPCPRCGLPMILRTAERGRNAGRKFWGCSAFPQCGGTRNAE